MLTIKYSTLIRAFSLSVLITFISHSGIFAQNLCSQTLKKAQKEYDEGRLTEVPGVLESCLKGGFTRDQQLQAYRLLILTYLFTDEPELAEQNLLNLLKEDPEYKINPGVDPAEFVTLYNTYNTSAVISIGLTGGANQTRPHLMRTFSTDNSHNKATYTPHVGFQGGLSADILIKKAFQVTTGFQIAQKNYEYSNSMFNYTNLNLKESQLWMEMPLALKYNFGYKKKLVPYIYGGAVGGLFLSSSGKLTRISNTGDNNASGPNVSLTSLRNKINYSALAGAGLKYKLGYGYISLDIKYTVGLKDIANANKRYSNDDLVYFYGYIDSDFKLNNFYVSVGYFKSFYHPKKLKKEIQ
ncbi:MAG: porin family protein [Cytophagaceae bacterium]